jgi:hypothetical protein
MADKQVDRLPDLRVRTVANGYVIEVMPRSSGMEIKEIYVAKSRAELSRVIAKIAIDALGRQEV